MAIITRKFDEDNTDNHEQCGSEYLIVRPDKGGVIDLLRCLVWPDIKNGLRFLDTSADVLRELSEHRWMILMSIIVCKILSIIGKPMEYTGVVVEFVLNLLYQNGGLFGLLSNFFHGKLVIPKRGTETFFSIIGHLDGRLELYQHGKLLEEIEKNSKLEMGDKALMDLCIMASKLAYENAKVVQNVVVHHWKMHFVGFYDCWNDFQKQTSTQVFILCDKPQDAKLILISFRGTEPFEAYDWSTDFDCSWYQIPKLGKVHMGFLEALGLGNRAKTAIFQHKFLMNNSNFDHSDDKKIKGWEWEQNSFNSVTVAQGQKMPPEMLKNTAYCILRRKLKSLLREHKNATFVVTGHSLGGALAILFSTVLVLQDETEIMQRFLGVYTFGQPRIGDKQVGKFMEANLEHQYPKYLRVVYCNDLVPRLPYDDKIFLYKHFGVCLYYDSCYKEQKMIEEPDRNFFGLRYLIPMHLNALWELIRSLIMSCIYGPDYKEGWLSILLRIMGLALPGISAHAATNYINSVRLGKKAAVQLLEDSAPAN